ncbi:adenylate/guanylate cyclase domain-containing protein [Arenibacterium sp. CAU 1754]
MATRLRIASGLVLFTYALFHFLNIGFGLISPDLLERGQEWRQVITRSWPGSVLLYGALLIHAGLALVKLAGRRTLRMPLSEAMQIALGLLIPLFLTAHVVYTRAAHELFDVNDRMGYLIGLIFGTPDGWRQSLLLLIVWTHGCIGLHYWLRNLPWWRRAQPLLVAAMVLVPSFALAGFLTEGRRLAALQTDSAQWGTLLQQFNWPSGATFAALARITEVTLQVIWAALILTAVVHFGRKIIGRRRSVRVRYVDGPDISAARGPTLLEMSRAHGVAHTALCGGRGRCTTCRVVIEDGADMLHPPSDAELRSLQAVNAPPGTRLACQIRPSHPMTVFRVFRPDGRRARAHASAGQERRMAVLFLDIRGFTARTTGQLPYDVVFLLNRFFDAIVPAITGTGGVVDKYLGDGLLALFETADESSSARAALQATARIGAALETFNQSLAREGAPELRIGIGLHLGNLVLGEIGAAGNAPRTIIGETVNAASRLEAKTKDIGVEVLVSSTVLSSAGIDVADLPLTRMDLRGVRTPVESLPIAKARDLEQLLAR